MNKVLLLYNTASYLYRFRRGLIDKLRQKGYKVITVASPDKYAKNIEEISDLFIPVEFNRDFRKPLSDVKLLFTLLKIYRKYKPDFALHYTIKANIYGTISAKINHIKVINTITGLGYIFLDNSVFSRFLRFIYRLILKLSDYVVFQNKEDVNIIGTRWLRRFKIVPGSGVDLNHYSPHYCQNNSSSNGGFTFLFIGRLLKTKGFLELVKAAEKIHSKYQNINFWVVGEIDEGNPSFIDRQLLEHYIKTGVIKYFGFQDDVREFICKADVVVLPSYREGLSRVLLEAASMGKPLLATNVPGCREIVLTQFNGILVEPRNVEALVEGIETFLKLSRAELQEMGKNSRYLVEKYFDEKIVVGEYLSVLNSLRR